MSIKIYYTQKASLSMKIHKLQYLNFQAMIVPLDIVRGIWTHSFGCSGNTEPGAR